MIAGQPGQHRRDRLGHRSRLAPPTARPRRGGWSGLALVATGADVLAAGPHACSLCATPGCTTAGSAGGIDFNQGEERTAALRGVRVPGLHDRHDLPGFGHEPGVLRDPRHGPAARACSRTCSARSCSPRRSISSSACRPEGELPRLSNGRYCEGIESELFTGDGPGGPACTDGSRHSLPIVRNRRIASW